MFMNSALCISMGKNNLYSTSWKYVLVSLLIFDCLNENSFSLAYSSTAAPRFDNFLDSLTSSVWYISSGVNADDDKHEIEEVMRSCGGAVQGIREFDIYHNRADDSFVYYNCGSYSTENVFSFTTKNGDERFVIDSSLENPYV